jgi:hypothetical protein
MSNMAFLNSPTVTLVVGPEDNRDSFVVHESLLTSRSLNFRNAMNGRWQESDDRVIPFPHEDPMAFRAYLTFVYHPHLLALIATNVTWANFDKEYTGLSGVYVVSDMLMDDGMKEAVFEQLKMLSDKKFLPSLLGEEKKLHAPPVEAIQFIYGGTTEKDPMRKLLVDLFTQNGDMSYAPHILMPSVSTVNLPADFTKELALSLMLSRALPQATADHVTSINGLKLENVSLEHQRNVHQRHFESKSREYASLEKDIDELRTRNDDWEDLLNSDPDVLFASLRGQPGEGAPYERSRAPEPGGVRPRQQMRGGGSGSLRKRAERQGLP